MKAQAARHMQRVATELGVATTSTTTDPVATGAERLVYAANRGQENPLFSGSAAKGGQRGAAVVDTSQHVGTFNLTQSVVAGESLLHPTAEAASVDERIDFLH